MKSMILAAGCALALLTMTDAASAMSMKDCSAKYKAAQTAGTLHGMTWNNFRKSECASTAGSMAAAKKPAPAAHAMTSSMTSPMAGGAAVFPTSVSSKYSHETPAKARMHTCLDQYNANKTSGRNGNLKWIMKGGGYYSACNKHLKG